MDYKEIVARLTTLEKKIAKLEKHPPVASPFLKRQEVIKLLRSRSLLERCEKAKWFIAVVREGRVVLYLREQVMAAVWRLSQGEFP